MLLRNLDSLSIIHASSDNCWIARSSSYLLKSRSNSRLLWSERSLDCKRFLIADILFHVSVWTNKQLLWLKYIILNTILLLLRLSTLSKYDKWILSCWPSFNRVMWNIIIIIFSTLSPTYLPFYRLIDRCNEEN